MIKNSYSAIKAILLILLTGVVLASCKSEDERPLPTPGRLEVKFKSGSRSWIAGDEVGLYMIQGVEALTEESILDDVNNMKLLAAKNSAGETLLLPAADDSILFPADGSNVSFVAYYPYEENLTGFSFPVDIGSQASGGGIDFRYSVNAAGRNHSSPVVDLQFISPFTSVTVSLAWEDEEGESEFIDFTVTMTGFPASAIYDLFLMNFKNKGNVADIEATRIETSGAFTATLIPTLASESYSRGITVEGPGYGPFSASIPSDIIYNADSNDIAVVLADSGITIPQYETEPGS